MNDNVGIKSIGSLMILIAVIFIDISYLCAAKEVAGLMEIGIIISFILLKTFKLCMSH